MLVDLLTTSVFTFMLLFVRVGTAFMVLPGFGEQYVPTTVRLGLSLAVTLALAPVVAQSVPVEPAQPLSIFLLIGGEAFIGLLIGGVARLIMTALHVAGTLIAFESGLAYALTIDPAQGVQGALIASFLSFLGVVVIFATDLHFLLLGAIADSYQLFVPGHYPPMGDFSQYALGIVRDTFKLGVQLAAPFIVFAMIMNAGLGVLARLMPALPIFFVVVPLQIWVAFLLLGVTMAGIVEFHTTYFEESMSQLLAPTPR